MNPSSHQGYWRTAATLPPCFGIVEQEEQTRHATRAIAAGIVALTAVVAAEDVVPKLALAVMG